MTVGRSKRRSLLTLTFIVKTVQFTSLNTFDKNESKSLLVITFFYYYYYYYFFNCFYKHNADLLTKYLLSYIKL